MKITKPKALLIAAVGAGIACLLQIFALVRYLGRLPDDWVGIGLYVVTIVAFALGAMGFYIQYNKPQQTE